MNNFKEFLEILKLPPSILSALMIVSGLILILPEDVVKKLYMYEFRNNYGFAISLIFLISLVVVNKVIDFMINKENGNWHEEKVEKSELHKHGVDIKLVLGKRNSEYFYIECKGKSYAKSARSINREGWLNALGQIITRMDVKRYTNIAKEEHIKKII